MENGCWIVFRALLVLLCMVGSATRVTLLVSAQNTKNADEYNWLAVPYQMRGASRSLSVTELEEIFNQGGSWQNAYGCQMILKGNNNNYGECWTGLQENYQEGACQYNDEEVEYDGLLCKAGFYATYDSFTVLGSAHLFRCNPPPDRPGQKNIDNATPGQKCDLVLSDSIRMYCYSGLVMDKDVSVAKNKLVGENRIYSWEEEVMEECYFGRDDPAPPALAPSDESPTKSSAQEEQPFNTSNGREVSSSTLILTATSFALSTMAFVCGYTVLVGTCVYM